jgi:hypothetical protein
MMRLMCLTALGLAFALGACGGDDDDGGGGGGGDKVSADAYAADMCKSASDWVKSLQQRATDLQGGLEPGTSPAEGKEALVGFLDDVIADTDDWISALDDVGVPDVEGGEDYASEIKTAAQDAKGVLEETGASVDDLPTDDRQAFAKEAGEVGDSAREALGKVGDAITAPESGDLRKALEDAPACKEIAAG